MISIEQLLGIILTEAETPHTHECHDCGGTFAPEGEGCPFCGKYANVSLVPELQNEEMTSVKEEE